MIKVDGKGGISATIVADSISEDGKQITTYELEYPRFIHSEFMTHRLFSRNAASSRAIPVNKMIEHVENNTAMPIHWGKNQPGMQAREELPEICERSVPYTPRLDEIPRERFWLRVRDTAVYFANEYHKLNAHKQIVNRLLEPFQFIKVVCTATEFDNFFWLRKHPDAQPEIAELAKVMWEAREQSEPMLLKAGEWHVPYVNYSSDVGYYLMKDGCHVELTLEDAIKVSASCCAQVSYRLADNSLEKAKKIYDMLVESKPVHASPFEHQATPMEIPSIRSVGGVIFPEDGQTHIDSQENYWSGNFKGWIQHRQLIAENACWDYKE